MTRSQTGRDPKKGSFGSHQEQAPLSTEPKAPSPSPSAAPRADHDRGSDGQAEPQLTDEREVASALEGLKSRHSGPCAQELADAPHRSGL